MPTAPGDYWALSDTIQCSVSADGAFPYTRAALARDLAEIGHPKAREVLIAAWIHCHVTTMRGLAGRMYAGQRGIELAVKLFETVRPSDPHIPLLPKRLTVWRGQFADNPGTGLSYTTDRAMARWFVDEFWRSRRPDGKGVVVKRVVCPDDVLAVVGPDEGRDENEILLRPGRGKR